MNNTCDLLITELSYDIVIRYLRNMNVSILNIRYLKDGFIIRLYKNDLPILDSICSFRIVKDSSWHGFFIFIKNYFFMFYFLLLFLGFISFFTSFILNIHIMISNRDLYHSLYQDLSFYGLKRYHFRLSDKQIENIKDSLLEEYKNDLEWINIIRKGMTYDIQVQLRKDKEPKENSDYCNIIAKKNAIVTKIISSNGRELVHVRDYVKKDDVLISGNVSDTLVCATGSVYGNVWYSIHMEIPKKGIHTTEINKDNYYMISIQNKDLRLFRNSNNYLKKYKSIFHLGWFRLNKVMEYDVRNKEYMYNNDEIDSIIDKTIHNKLHDLIDGNYTIRYQNVLKKDSNNSTISIDVFLVVEEEIGVTS